MDEINYPAIGRRIRYVRIGKNLTQAELAELAEISVNYVSHIENGAAFSLSVFIRLLNALTISADFILADVLSPGSQGGANVGDYQKLSQTHVECINKMIHIISTYHVLK